MEAHEFLKEYRRMCNSYEHCEGCPLSEKQCLAQGLRRKTDREYLTITSDVEQWSKDHQIITNAQKFEEVFGWPQADIDSLRYARAWWDEPYKEQRGRNEG